MGYLERKELNKSKVLTFIWEEQCREDFKFTYEGVAAECRGCRFAPVCHGNLAVHRTYRVSKLKDKIVECKAFGKHVRLVEVEEAVLEVAVRPESAINGAVIRFQPPICSEVSCKYYEKCVPAALREGDAIKIVSVGTGFNCPTYERRLIEVSVLPYQTQP
ncbi:MAG: UPF0179 family protein [Candidatus Bathyarchaeia archaeon]